MTGSLALLREGADVLLGHAETRVQAVVLLDNVERDVLQLVRRRSRILTWITIDRSSFVRERLAQNSRVGYTHACGSPSGQLGGIIGLVEIGFRELDGLHLVPENDVLVELDQTDVVPDHQRAVHRVGNDALRLILVASFVEVISTDDRRYGRVVEAGDAKIS